MNTCCKCHNPATVFVSSILQENTCIKKMFCSDHAKEGGFCNKNVYALLESMPRQSADPSSTPAKCPRCGYPKYLFEKTGLLGCSQCYETVRKELGLLLPRIHTGKVHLGKIPKQAFDRLSVENQIASLSQALKQAVEKEDFENAAWLRDQIKTLQNTIEAF